ncbi:hypothetical protein INP51_03810 [Blautia liquoris]|jgi:hypothetical protein|uniref:Uncharacterized protein n=1 Tax=Blautia liquoris TaxID=2779518 RepID=A0A7M2RIX9_9FIRM|nr:hypothetical protein [Blautia liquoris]QOV20088.1 hypothetical protein INP51_03810 [Blautia liquoris]
MKKAIKYIIAAFVIIGFSSLYANIDKEIPIYDKTVDTALYGNMGELHQGIYIQQEFISKKSVLDGISIKFGTYGIDLTSTYDYQILDGDSGKIIRNGILKGADVENGKFHVIRFKQIKGCKNQNFVFRFGSSNAQVGNALTVFNVPKGKERVKLTLNTDSFDHNTLAMRTVSHQFDVETFISVIFALTYLYVFIIILFKFFN